jgi:hypothetical protein
MLRPRSWPGQPDSNQTASGKPGAVHPPGGVGAVDKDALGADLRLHQWCSKQGDSACRRATALSVAPGPLSSATIVALRAALQRRRVLPLVPLLAMPRSSGNGTTVHRWPPRRNISADQRTAKRRVLGRHSRITITVQALTRMAREQTDWKREQKTVKPELRLLPQPRAGPMNRRKPYLQD